jgi:hypothetical protein
MNPTHVVVFELAFATRSFRGGNCWVWETAFRQPKNRTFCRFVWPGITVVFSKRRKTKTSFESRPAMRKPRERVEHTGVVEACPWRASGFPANARLSHFRGVSQRSPWFYTKCTFPLMGYNGVVTLLVLGSSRGCGNAERCTHVALLALFTRG